MNRFKRYQCDTCKKEVDLDNNITHAFIDKCNLTAGCAGRLRFVSEKNTKDNILNFENAVQGDRIGGLISTTSLGEYISLSSSSSNDLVLAIESQSYPQSAAVEVMFEEAVGKERSFKEFAFNLTVPVIAFSGKDDSVEQKVLMFDNTDIVKIFINGQEISPEKYIAENNVIKFSEQIVYSTYSSSSLFVKVLVFIPTTTVNKTLTFKKNVPGLSQGAWSNVDKVTFNGKIYELFTCVNHLSLDVNTRLTFKSKTINNQQITSPGFLLLSDAPFVYVDRIFTRAIQIDELNSSTHHIKYDTSFNVTANSISDLYPPIHVLSVFNADAESEILETIGTDVSANLNITKNNKYILGPV